MHLLAYIPEETRVVPISGTSGTFSQLVIGLLCLCALVTVGQFWKMPDYGKGEVSPPWHMKLFGSIIILIFYGAIIYFVNWLSS